MKTNQQKVEKFVLAAMKRVLIDVEQRWGIPLEDMLQIGLLCAGNEEGRWWVGPEITWPVQLRRQMAGHYTSAKKPKTRKSK